MGDGAGHGGAEMGSESVGPLRVGRGGVQPARRQSPFAAEAVVQVVHYAERHGLSGGGSGVGRNSGAQVVNAGFDAFLGGFLPAFLEYPFAAPPDQAGAAGQSLRGQLPPHAGAIMGIGEEGARMGRRRAQSAPDQFEAGPGAFVGVGEVREQPRRGPSGGR